MVNRLFFGINVLQGSAATYVRCVEIHNNLFTEHLLQNLQWKNFGNRLRFDGIMAMSSVYSF